MSDFEVMPIGTAETIGAAARILRDIEAVNRKFAARKGSPYARRAAVAASLYGNMAARLEALLPGPNGAKRTVPTKETES